MQSINNLFNWFRREPPVDLRAEAIKSLATWESEGDVEGAKKNILWLLEHHDSNFEFPNMHLTNLPPAIWKLTYLFGLNVITNRLTSLPSEIGRMTKLTMLFIGDNQLTSIPTEIGCLTNLQYLGLNKNQLKSLPIEIGNCRRLVDLAVEHNPDLPELPMSLGQITDLTNVSIEGTRVDYRTRRAILNQCQCFRSEEAAAILPLRLQTWKAMAKSVVDVPLDEFTPGQKIDLNEWLLRLEKTRDFHRSQARLAGIVYSMLLSVCENAEFKELFFAQVAVNNTSCEDRAAMSLNEIYTSWKSGAEELKIMTGVAKTLALRKELAKRIPSGERESVEIYLYYETLFKEHLCTAIEEMAYGDIGKRDWINPEQLMKRINETYFDHLIDLPAFEKLAKKELSAEWEIITKKALNELTERPAGDDLSEAVLMWQHNQGKVMQERQRAWSECVKKWYFHAVN